MGKDKRPYRIVAAYDTETCNLGRGDDARAYPVLYIFNDLRGCDIASYEPDACGEQVIFQRTWSEAVGFIEELVEYGAEDGLIPVVCAYNLLFDLQPILHELRARHGMSVNAQSATNVYTLDLLDEEGKVALRFWDTFHLEMGGLAAMGRTCGFAKATGEWDYSLVRTPDTPLTDEELDYARRDVQVIPAYLRYLLEANEWLDESQFGNEVITKTSLVRQMAKRVIGCRRVRKANGRRENLQRLFENLCRAEFPEDFGSYALRKACFRGGLTFTAAAYASTVQRHVLSTDVTSMHHLFINGRRIPTGFGRVAPDVLTSVAEGICSLGVNEVLEHYDHPFLNAIHARIRFKGLRLKSGSVFEREGIALLAQAKFDKVVRTCGFEEDNIRALEAEAVTRAHGYRDSAADPVFAFGKLYSASEAVVFVNEVELWNMSRVYEWDGMEALEGELSVNAALPPDYVTLQSNLLFARKTDAKTIASSYVEGEPYGGEVPTSIPEGIRQGLGDGTLSAQFFSSWYQSTVKGAFNSIYGTMAQDVLRPEYEVLEDAEFKISDSSRVSPETYDAKRPKSYKVLYTYGMRIVAGSRQHLVIAMELINEALGGRVRITGGDTDSIKVSCDGDVSAEDVLAALEPLHRASRAAIADTQRRVRETASDLASGLDHIGCFEVEPASSDSDFWDWHLEAWNKARVSVSGGRSHVTCAGLSRPKGTYHIESFIDDALKTMPADELLPLVLGYNVNVDNSICHALEHKRPNFADKVEEDVTDYLGNTCHVDTYASIALYPVGRWLGDTIKNVNRDNVDYLAREYGRDVPTAQRFIRVTGEPELWVDTDDDDSVNVLLRCAR